MPPHFAQWQCGPLNLFKAELSALHPSIPQVFNRGGLDAAWWNFKALIEVVNGARGKEAQQDWHQRASASQTQSLDILHQWWAGKLRAPKKTLQLQDAIQKAQEHAEGWPVNEENAKTFGIAGKKVWMPINPGCDESKYAHDLLILWLHEFYFGEKDVDGEFILNLEKTRSYCQSLAISHRLAHAVFPSMINGVPRPSRLPEAMDIGEPAQASSVPCPWLDLRTDRSVDDSTRRQMYPAYLWDIKNRETVETSSLEILPKYWVLSHTWGRWRRKTGSGGNVGYKMDGVPWPVPENDIFDVKELAEKLMKLVSSWPCLYFVWIDLFCIPQEGAGPGLDEVHKVEIGKQASIFRMASWAVVWMNQVKNWKGLEGAIQWLLLHYISRHVPLKDVELCESFVMLKTVLQHGIQFQDIGSGSSRNNTSPSIGPTTVEIHAERGEKSFEEEQIDISSLSLNNSEIQQSITGLGHLISVKDGSDVTSPGFKGINKLVALKPAPYLTGLWTLQEACLCPTLRLLGAELEPLTMGSCQQEVTLDTLYVELVNIMFTSDFDEMPRGVMEVIGALTATGLSRLLSISALDLLELGSRRWCRHSRGQAIMSAVGVTDWYEKQDFPNLNAEDEKGLLLGHYPFEFIQSVREKAGAGFFASQRDRIRHVFSSDSIQKLKINSLSMHGTMLPFYWGAWTGRWRPQDFKDHPSSASWTLNRNSSVNIHEAGILLSTDRLNSSKIEAEVFIEPFLLKTSSPMRFETLDLHDSLDSVVRRGNANYGELYALVLMYNEMRMEGILVFKPMLLGTYAKIGNFYLGPDYTALIPPSETVDWVVG